MNIDNYLKFQYLDNLKKTTNLQEIMEVLDLFYDPWIKIHIWIKTLLYK